MKNGLHIVATPIGNLGDISFRALETLKNCDIVACEDTRNTKKLFSLLGVGTKKTFIALHDHNEEKEALALADLAKQKAVVLVSDAGSPLISDPGYKLVKTCKEEGVYLTTLPGACAVVSALQLSGLPTNQFFFAGFIPNKDKARKDFLLKLKNIEATMVFYETAPRILKTLEVIKDIFKNCEVSIAREITKMYEECFNGSAEDLIAKISQTPLKGELVLMLSPKPEAVEINLEKVLKSKMRTLSLKDAVKAVVEEHGLNKNEVYEKALSLKNTSPSPLAGEGRGEGFKPKCK